MYESGKKSTAGVRRCVSVILYVDATRYLEAFLNDSDILGEPNLTLNLRHIDVIIIVVWNWGFHFQRSVLFLFELYNWVFFGYLHISVVDLWTERGACVKFSSSAWLPPYGRLIVRFDSLYEMNFRTYFIYFTTFILCSLYEIIFHT